MVHKVYVGIVFSYSLLKASKQSHVFIEKAPTSAGLNSKSSC